MTEPNPLLKARTRAVIVHMRTHMPADAVTILVPPSEWDDVEGDPTDVHKPFGHTIPSTEGPRLVMRFCAERIAEQSLHLDDGDFGRYLEFVEGHVHMHISHIGEVMSGFYTLEEIEGVIDRTLTEAAPRLVAIGSEVQTRARKEMDG